MLVIMLNMHIASQSCTREVGRSATRWFLCYWRVLLFRAKPLMPNTSFQLVAYRSPSDSQTVANQQNYCGRNYSNCTSWIKTDQGSTLRFIVHPVTETETQLTGLTHWSLVINCIYTSGIFVNICLGNGLPPARRQAIIPKPMPTYFRCNAKKISFRAIRVENKYFISRKCDNVVCCKRPYLFRPRWINSEKRHGW